MPRPTSWTVADLLDFEYLLAADAGLDDAQLRDRDRPVRAVETTSHPIGRRALFKSWLETRRAALAGKLPGENFRAGWQTLLTLAALLGLAIGATLTAGLLHYRGEEPVNVAWFLAATVGLQTLLLALAIATWLLRRVTSLLDDFRPLHALLAGLLWALSAGWQRVPGEQRERLRALLATLRHRRTSYRLLTVWPVIIVTQLFGVGFNLGVLATLLLHVALSDVAFGWSSTLRTSPEEVFAVAKALATPWLALPNAHPSFAEVVASRFAYSSGIAPLSSTAMASWWPFLSYAVAFYGLLIRTLLLLFATGKWRRALGAIAFDHPTGNALFRRLAGPFIQTEADTATLAIPAATEFARDRSSGECVALLPPELALDPDLLATTLRERYGWRLAQTLNAAIDHPSSSGAAFAAIEQLAPRLAGLAVIVPARRPPIKAIALFLQKLAAAAGPKVEVLVLLTGRSLESEFAPVGDEEFTHWRNFSAIHGLHLGIEKWPAS